MKKIFSIIVFLLILHTSFSQDKYWLFTGTYTSTTSTGIYIHSFDSKTGEASAIDSIKTSNPSFLAFSPNYKTLYAVNENVDGEVSVFSFNRKKTQLSFIKSISSNGKHPCYIDVDKTGKWIAVGNYSSGNFSVPAAPGNPLETLPVITMGHEGKSVDEKRQASPHVHSTVFSPDNKFLLVNDLGIDKIVVYRFFDGSGLVRPSGEIAIAAGSGPRHLAFHPQKDYLYLLNELNGTINVFRYQSDNGKMQPLQTISSVDSSFKGYAGSADIHLSADGKFLYASNRGDANNIAIFSVNERDGLLTNIGFQPVLGKAPRNFSIDPSGKFLLVANQDSDEIVVFNRDVNTGLLTESDKRILIPRPVCLKWVKQ